VQEFHSRETAGTLAIDGGTPVRCAAAPLWPVIDTDEIASVVATLQSGKINQWTGGPGGRVQAFERAFAQSLDRPHAIAVANGTVALETMLRAYDIGAGHEVVVTPRSFIASASCVNLVGATPVFADVDPETEMITPATVKPLIGSRTKAIIVVHLHGRPADMPGFVQLARQHGLLMFEDCAQAQGARINGRPVGAFGDASAFSFCHDKIMTTGGEGGMAVFAERRRWKRAWSYRENGKDYDEMHEPHQGGYRSVYTGFGTNARMTEMQAAIGLQQLEKVDAWIATRSRNAQLLASWLGDHPCVSLCRLQEGFVEAHYRFAFRIDPHWLKPGWNRDRIMKALIAEGIPCFSGVR
jgi:dTDP-4-amino-4,6-dideoxygalactose transaminase